LYKPYIEMAREPEIMESSTLVMRSHLRFSGSLQDLNDEASWRVSECQLQYKWKQVFVSSLGKKGGGPLDQLNWVVGFLFWRKGKRVGADQLCPKPIPN